MHAEAFEYVRRQVARLGPFERVVEVGARDVNGSVRWLFGDADYTGVDIIDGVNVDVVADAADWEPPEPPACVVCCEVLEHTPRAREIILAAGSWMKEGGILIVTCATNPRAPHSALDGHLLAPGEWYDHASAVQLGEFYRNVSKPTLEMWLDEAGFNEWEAEVLGGDLRAVGWR